VLVYSNVPPKIHELMSSKPQVKGKYAAGGTVWFIDGSKTSGQAIFYETFTF